MVTSRIEIVLSDSANAFVEKQLVHGTYRDASEFFEALIHEAQHKAELDDIDSKLLDALAGPPATPLTPEFWDNLESEARRRAMDRQDRR
ncbi:MAG: hypothetical protein P4L84_00920 [Isosphaeraceae bacterium]|nr:hypothetical protein [Isosphaeraceae bacterium]